MVSGKWRRGDIAASWTKAMPLDCGGISKNSGGAGSAGVPARDNAPPPASHSHSLRVKFTEGLFQGECYGLPRNLGSLFDHKEYLVVSRWHLLRRRGGDELDASGGIWIRQRRRSA